ncbi:monovalent cation:proton antiporter-2 (CPA2) family protein [Niveibacterium sp. 24ML]|uniref:monovalent cation:proton antiporter-2 (CPA2) family protein n=1 Tax=Niveibacterium sp. 24ML TaxID=2985512 RepID=UPI00226EDB8F|nr:monovalent cation:proton antiporter-2 (CPA2) family protein [Niveibacterium sp. 24ML]MCX9157741.1 monovalent cation:proton antiporter-2 (CPA2) family protein [Niveibacterium sp. 24ML]
MNSLTTFAALIGAAVLLVPLFKRAKLGTVLGYLATGVLVGPFGFNQVSDPESLLHTAELGIVLLLFVIGLELQPSRLWALRRQVFGLGGLQMVGCGVAIGLVAAWGFGLSVKASLLIGWTLALSSTALVLPTLAERKELTTQYGRESFAVLLFQDLSVIPLLALIPLLDVGLPKAGRAPLVGLAVLLVVVLVGRKLLHWLFVYVARFGSRELFTAAALLCALGLASLMAAVGLSMSLGAFVAGVLLADSEFRHELEATIDPFKGLLLGLFFMAVGMNIDLDLLATMPARVIGMALGLIAIKLAVLWVLRLLAPDGASTARPLALALAQGGEFAFVVTSMVEQGRLVPGRLAEQMTLAVAISMALAPLLFLANDWFARREAKKPARPYDELPTDPAPVVIAGFGRVGQVVGRVLMKQGIRFTAVDSDPDQVETVRRFGMKVFYGDTAHLALLESAQLSAAKVFVLAIDDVEHSLQVAELVRRHYPKVAIVARARNRFHAYRLIDLGVTVQVRETLLSSVEMGREVLDALGVPDEDIAKTVARFLDNDRMLLARQQAVYHDEQQLIQTSKEAREELASILDVERRQDKREKPERAERAD